MSATRRARLAELEPARPAGAATVAQHVARLGAACIAQGILVRDRAGADIGDDFHRLMSVRGEAGMRLDRVVIPDAQGAFTHPFRVVISGKGKMVIGVQPVIVEPAKLFEGSVFNHGDILSRSCVVANMTLSRRACR